MARKWDKKLSREEAVSFYDAGWQNLPIGDRVSFQLEQERLCMPFEQFYAELSSLIGRKPTLLEIKSERKNLLKEINRVKISISSRKGGVMK